jgi:hypothetical protein
VCLVRPSLLFLLLYGLYLPLSAVSYYITTTIPLTTFGIHVILKGHFLNRAQILVAFQGVRWAPSSTHLCPGRTAHSARSNQWRKVSRSCPIQPVANFSNPPLTNIRFISTELASLHFQEWQGISCLYGWLHFARTKVIHHQKSCATLVSIPCYASAWCGRCDRCFCWWFLGSLKVLLLQRCCVSSSLLILPPPAWITSSMVIHVIVHYDNRVILTAISWVPGRILRRFWLSFRVWCEAHTLHTSVLAEPHTAPRPVSKARAPDHVPAKIAIISQLHQGQTRPSISPELYQLGRHGSQYHYFSFIIQHYKLFIILESSVSSLNNCILPSFWKSVIWM